MGTRSFTLFPSDDRPWRLAVVESGRAEVTDLAACIGATVATQAAAVRAALNAHGYRGQAVTLALPSRWCLSAVIAADGLPRKDRRQAMLYLLEEQLPLAAEDMAADFLLVADSIHGVAVAVRDVKPLLDALEEGGIAVESVSPAAVLGLQHALGTSPPAAEGMARNADAVLWTHDTGVELFSLTEGRPGRWSFGTKADEMRLHLAALAPPGRGTPRRLWSVGQSPAFVEQMTRAGAVREVGRSEMGLEPSAALAADQIRAGRTTGWIELRRDGLAANDGHSKVNRPLMAALAASAVFFASMCVALLWRSAHYQRVAREHVAAQNSVFESTLPGQAVPPNPVSRLASEERRMRLLSGDAPGTQAATRQASALLLLRDVLSVLPDGVRIRVSELRFSDAGFDLQGQALSHADAGAVAAALRDRAGFAVEVPRSEQLGTSGTVGFTISGAAETNTRAGSGVQRRPGQ